LSTSAGRSNTLISKRGARTGGDDKGTVLICWTASLSLARWISRDSGYAHFLKAISKSFRGDLGTGDMAYRKQA
jgi:hypothetical protein